MARKSVMAGHHGGMGHSEFNTWRVQHMACSTSRVKFCKHGLDKHLLLPILPTVALVAAFGAKSMFSSSHEHFGAGVQYAPPAPAVCEDHSAQSAPKIWIGRDSVGVVVRVVVRVAGA